MFPGGELLPRAAMQHSMHPTVPYLNHVVDEEVETLAHLVNVLLVPQRLSMGSWGAHCRASPARPAACTMAGLGYAGWGCRWGEQHI